MKALLVYILFFGFYACQSASKPSEKTLVVNQPSKLNRSMPWLWTCGFLRFQDSVSIAELKQKNTNIFVLQGTEHLAKQIQPGLNYTPISRNQFIKKHYNEGILFLPLDSMHMQLKALVADSLFYFSSPLVWKWYQNGLDSFQFNANITKFTHTGVTAITRATGNCIDRIGPNAYIANILPYFQNSDYVHISNEVSFDTNCLYKPGMSFCTKAIHFEILKALHVNLVELTGNHNKDYGPQTFINTYEWYIKNNIKPFGGGRNEDESSQALILNLKGGQRLALLGFNESCPSGECAVNKIPGAQRYSEDFAKSKIAQLKASGVNFIVVGVQFNESDHYAPLPKQIQIAKKLIDFGADMVYGSQAHVIQHVEFYKGKIIYYGLGNFLFDQIHSRGVRQAMFMDHYFYKGQLIATRHWYTYMQQDRIPNLAPYTEKRHIQSQIWLPNLLLNH